MIKANELRIGNWVEYNETATLFQVTDIGYSGIGVKNKDEETWIELDQFSPVALTPEILEKAGFKRGIDNNGNLVVFRKSKYTIAWWGTKWQMWIGSVDFYLSPQHVHQLQNLYFALTGEELPIKL